MELNISVVKFKKSHFTTNISNTQAELPMIGVNTSPDPKDNAQKFTKHGISQSHQEEKQHQLKLLSEFQKSNSQSQKKN